MIKIHSTKKLLAKLPLDGSGMVTNTRVNANALAIGDSPLGSWHANLLNLQRHNCILFVYDATRFPVFSASGRNVPALSVQRQNRA
ncbi:DUF6933 domain-containing protein [Teredinibacter turnerae]|uniref:DUF6933 domain-containing protein n=1 Tax=Teredinibacter turnerae TaxID=2426 RepID=UPI003BB0B1B7